MDINIPRFRKFELNEIVSVELPAHVWLQFLNAYTSTEWADGNATIIALTIRNILLDPVSLNEMDANYQEAQDRMQQHNSGILGMLGLSAQPPDDPRLDPS